MHGLLPAPLTPRHRRHTRYRGCKRDTSPDTPAYMNARAFSRIFAEPIARIDKPNVETRNLQATARAGDSKRTVINFHIREHAFVDEGARQFSVLPQRDITSPAHSRSPLVIQTRKSMHQQAHVRSHRRAIRSNDTIVKECQILIR